MIFVQKRDGTKEVLNLNKFHKVIENACEDLVGVSVSEIEIKSHNDLTTNYESMEKKQAYFDFQWIAFHKFDVKLGIGKIPKHIGVITLNEDGFSLIRSAERNELMGTRAIETAKVLLGKFVKR